MHALAKQGKAMIQKTANTVLDILKHTVLPEHVGNVIEDIFQHLLGLALMLSSGVFHYLKVSVKYSTSFLISGCIFFFTAIDYVTLKNKKLLGWVYSGVLVMKEKMYDLASEPVPENIVNELAGVEKEDSEKEKEEKENEFYKRKFLE